MNMYPTTICVCALCISRPVINAKLDAHSRRMRNISQNVFINGR